MLFSCQKTGGDIVSEGTSVGKIFLETEVRGDLEKQIRGMTEGIQKSLQNTLNGFQKSMNEMMSKSFKMPKMDTGSNQKFIQNTFGSMTNKIKNFTQTSVTENSKVAKSISKMTAEYEKTEAQITKINQELADLFAQQDAIARNYRDFPAITGMTKEESFESMLRSDPKYNKLSSDIDKLIAKVDPLIEKKKKLSHEIENVGKSAERAGGGLRRLDKDSKQADKTVGASSKTINRFSSMLNRMILRLFIFSTAIKAIKAFGSYMASSLKTNAQFSNSLAQVKTNLQVAFMPIYQAILPALNALMRALATVTTYIATFVSAIFGKTYKQSFQAAQGLNAARNAMDGYGKATKKAAKEVKGALAGFDEVNILDTGKDADADPGGGGGGGGIAPLVAPSMDMSPMQESIKKFMAKFKVLLEPAREALKRLKEAFEPLKQNIFAGLKWLLDNVLVPLGKWTISEVLPRFIDILAGALRILNSVIEILKPLFLWLWDNFLLPIAKWTGGAILDILDGIAYAFNKIADFIGGIKDIAANADSFLEAFVNVGLYIVDGILTGIVHAIVGIGTWLWENLIKPIIDWVKKLFGISSPSKVFKDIGTQLIDGLKAGIANTWGKITKFFEDVINKLKKFFADAWNGIKTTATNIWNGIKTFFTNSWNSIRTTASNIFNGIKTTISNIFNSVKTIISNIWNGIKNTITNIWNGMRNTATNVFNKIRNSIVNVFDGLKTKLTSIWNGIWTGIKKVINQIIRGVNTMIRGLNKLNFSLPSWIPGIGGKSFGINIPQIPLLAKGGIIDQPTLAMIGENRKKEAVVPLEQNTGWIKILAAELTELMGSGGNDEDTGDLVFQIDGDEFARISLKLINKRRRKAGLPLLVL